MKKIGLLGGIGPESTGMFYLSLIKGLQKTGKIKSNTDFPNIIINSIPAPELIFKEDLGMYIQGLKELDKCNVDFIAMICNTVHSFYGELQKEINTPIIDLRKEFDNFIIENNIKSTLLLATPVSLKMNLYRNNIIKNYELEKFEIDMIGNAIINFNLGIGKNKQSSIVEGIANKYVNKGAELVVLGCTEIGLMLSDSKLNKLNTMDLLAQVIIKKSFE